MVSWGAVTPSLSRCSRDVSSAPGRGGSNYTQGEVDVPVPPPPATISRAGDEKSFLEPNSRIKGLPVINWLVSLVLTAEGLL